MVYKYARETCVGLPTAGVHSRAREKADDSNHTPCARLFITRAFHLADAHAASLASVPAALRHRALNWFRVRRQPLVCAV